MKFKKSRYQIGESIQIFVSFYGFPKLYIFEVVDPIKKSAVVEGRKRKHTILVKEPTDESGKTYRVPTNMIGPA